MRKTLAIVVLTLLVMPLSLYSQKNAKGIAAPMLTEWSDPDVFEQHKLYPRVNVVGYKYENDIEKDDYRSSPYYVSLAGKWSFDIQNAVSLRPDMENKKLDVSGWGKINVPNYTWKYKGADVKVPEIGNVADLPDKGNYIATYYREFNVSTTWKDYEAFLQVQGKSAYYVWINNVYAGYSEDSRALSEFNITQHLKYGKVNTIAIQVLGLSDGSLLESDYSHSVNGLTHDVAIVLKPAVNINDYKIVTDYDEKTTIGEMQLTATVSNKFKKGLYYLEAEIWTPQGKQLDKMAKWVAFDKRNEVDVTMKRDFAAIEPWSAETPSLYTLILRLRDNNMNLVEVTGGKFGFRKIEMDGTELLVNGAPVKLRGVAYANYDMSSGGEPSYENMEKDLVQMKRYNINAIRTTVYSPADDEFYKLCDKYGFYVVCEANIQPYSTTKKAIATDGDYENLFVARVQNMYEPLKNHPSIIAWSLGTGHDNGVCMERAYAALKQKDKERPVIFAGAGYSENTDIVAISETDPDALKAAAVKKQSRPILLNSFGAVCGNGFGGMENVWRLVSDNSKFLGGFVQYWSPVTIHAASSQSDDIWEGLTWNDGNNKPHQMPYLQELGNIYRPFDVRLVSVSQDACEFVISCRSGVQSVGNYVLEYNMFSNLKPHIVGGEIELALKPGDSKTFRLKMPVLNLYIAEELFVRFSVNQRVRTAAVPQGTTLASVEMPLPTKRLEKIAYENHGSLTTSVANNQNGKRGVLTVTGQRFVLKYDLDNADITNYNYDNSELITSPLRSTIHRPPTYNDGSDRNGMFNWTKYKESSLTRTVQAVNFRQIDENTVVIDAMVGYSLNGSPVYSLKQTIAVLSSGDVVIDNSIDLDNSVKSVARVGFETQVPNRLNSVSWFGRKNETYIDRCSTGDLGSYKEQADRMAFDYNIAQASGNRADVRWFAVTDGQKGLFVDMIDTTFNFSVCRFDDNQIGGLSSDLKPDNHRAVHIDFKMSGVGSAKAGYHLTDGALVKDRKYRFRIHLRGYDLGDNDAEDFRRIAYPSVESGVLPMPEMQKDRERFNAPMLITIKSSIPDAEIRYTLDGSEPTESSPLYKAPIKISSSTIVSARAFKKGYAPSFVARNHYSFDYVKSTTLEHKPNTPYNKQYQTALFDAEYGDVNNLSSGWLGFSASDMSVVLELAKEINLESVELRFAHNPDAWAFAPTAVDVYVSQDGVTYSEPMAATITYDPQSESMNMSQLVTINVYVEKPNVRYVKVVAKNMGRIPSWHRNKGLRPWLMTDEVKLNERIGGKL
ncbi:MAG: chitobiase/beta-hexosaminidase C-terminal domain-containing protein [Bacteroidales bacterium]|nr:chitobiase/beta-hexosaminidase C-terminal domain-containing protein [Bacteroidales bacterium]